MDELVRVKMHEALDVEKPDGGLRSRVVGSLPAAEHSAVRFGTPSFHWMGGFLAALIAVAVVATFLYARGALSLQGLPATVPSPSPISAVNGTCQPQDVELSAVVNSEQTGLGVEMTIGISFPNGLSCTSPDVTAELEDALGAPLVGVEGSPLMANRSHSCSTNVSAKCNEETPLYWSNWCGPMVGPFRITATAFGGRVHSSSLIPAPPPCTNRQDPSFLGGLH
jgi:hypothetical protein